MADSFITINKGMVLNQRKHQTGDLEQKLWMQIGTTIGQV